MLHVKPELGTATEQKCNMQEQRVFARCMQNRAIRATDFSWGAKACKNVPRILIFRATKQKCATEQVQRSNFEQKVATKSQKSEQRNAKKRATKCKINWSFSNKKQK